MKSSQLQLQSYSALLLDKLPAHQNIIFSFTHNPFLIRCSKFCKLQNDMQENKLKILDLAWSIGILVWRHFFQKVEEVRPIRVHTGLRFEDQQSFFFLKDKTSLAGSATLVDTS